MPIQRLNQPPQFPRIGKLRKGGAKVDPKRPGADLGEAFRFVADSAEVQSEFDVIYGKTPKSVMFMFPPHQHVDEVLVCWYEHHLATRLMRRCDGVAQSQWWDATRGKYSFEPKACEGNNGERCPLCRTTAHLKIWIPQLMRRAFIEVPFSSTWDVIHLQQYLGAFAQANGGTLMGIPFVLSRRKMKVAYVEAGGASKTGEKWLLHVEPHPSWEKKQVAQLMQSLNDAPQIEAPAGSVIVDQDDDDDEAPPPTDDSWKGEIIALGKRAGELISKVTAELATNLSAAQSQARTVLQKNGHSNVGERLAAVDALSAAIKAAEEALPA